jgi:hypothetical protein
MLIRIEIVEVCLLHDRLHAPAVMPSGCCDQDRGIYWVGWGVGRGKTAATGRTFRCRLDERGVAVHDETRLLRAIVKAQAAGIHADALHRGTAVAKSRTTEKVVKMNTKDGESLFCLPSPKMYTI